MVRSDNATGGTDHDDTSYVEEWLGTGRRDKINVDNTTDQSVSFPAQLKKSLGWMDMILR